MRRDDHLLRIEGELLDIFSSDLSAAKFIDENLRKVWSLYAFLVDKSPGALISGAALAEEWGQPHDLGYHRGR